MDAERPHGAWRNALPALGGLLLIVVGAIVVAAIFDSARGVASLQTGECLFAPETEQITQVEPVSCDEPHELEVIGTTTLQGTQYPGDDDIFTAGLEACREVFESYVGEAYDTSRWFLNTFTPSEEGWNAGDRAATCLIFQFDENLDYIELTGSVRTGT